MAHCQPHTTSPHFLQRLARFYLGGAQNLFPLNACTFPPAGPAILVCNHISGLDPVILQSLCPRPIIWMMAREYYDMPLLQWFYRAIQAIPVERNGRDFVSTRAAFRALDAGQILGVFPEGRIAPTPHILEFQTGAALIALRSAAPVYTAALDGTSRDKNMDEVFLYPQSTCVAFGPIVEFDRPDSDRQTIENATLAMRDAVANLFAVCRRFNPRR